jgi:hypothetical protein
MTLCVYTFCTPIYTMDRPCKIYVKHYQIQRVYVPYHPNDTTPTGQHSKSMVGREGGGKMANDVNVCGEGAEKGPVL